MVSKKLVLTSLSILALFALVVSSSAQAATRGQKLARLNGNRELNASSTESTGTSTLRSKHIERKETLKTKPLTAKLKGISFRGTVQSLSGTTLTVNASTTTYTIDSSKAKVVGMKGHKGDLVKIQTGDTVKVTGKVNTDGTIKALLIRDSSRAI